ncbi:MAG TPA: hypothetical protein VNP98_08980 [Chthoniobacterales bacterium]|nr:hypothetical protein [Chthoniobacterales bacterium]
MSFTLKRTQCVLPVFFLVLAGISPALAQDVRVETQQQARVRAEITQEEETTEEPTDPELGDINLVSRAPRPKMFTFSTLQTLNYSSNAFLTRDNTLDDFFWNGGVGASFVPYATRNFTPRLSLGQSWFRYEDFPELDFDSQTLALDLKYDLDRNDTWSVIGSYAVARLYSPDDATGEFYRYGFLNASISRFSQIGSAPFYLNVTGGAYWRHGDPSASDRVSGYFNVAAIYNICEKVQLWGFTRPEVQHYTHDLSGSSRDDFNVTVGASLIWNPQDYLSVGTTVSYVGNFSTVGVRRYDLVTPTVFIGAQWAF